MFSEFWNPYRIFIAGKRTAKVGLPRHIQTLFDLSCGSEVLIETRLIIVTECFLKLKRIIEQRVEDAGPFIEFAQLPLDR